MLGKTVRGYETLITIGNALQSVFLLAMRLFWGWHLFQFGLGKLHDIPSFATGLANLGFPLPVMQAYIGATIECVGGLCLLLGFASRLMAIPVIVMMAIAYWTAHRESILALFSDPNQFIEQAPFLYLLTALIVFVFGPGKISIDYLIQRFIFKKSD